MNKERDQLLMGVLINLSYTRTNIAYAMSLVSQFMNYPSKKHMKVVVCIVQLTFSLRNRLMLRKYNNLNIDGYTYANLIGSITNIKSTSRYFSFVVEILSIGEVRRKSS